MFFIRKPTADDVQQFVSKHKDAPFSYSEVGQTRGAPPAGYAIDHNRIKLGQGFETFERAVAALRAWRHFDLGWASIVPEGTKVEVGAVVAVLPKSFGLWSLNACRIVYVSDEPDDCRKKFTFAYGTLHDHAECGEERFTIEWQQDGSVWYDLYAFSWPQHPLVKLGAPFGRMLQRRFARESLAAMKRATALDAA